MVQSSLKHFFMHTYNLLSHFIYNIIIVLLRFCKLILHPKFMQLFWKKDKEVTCGNLNHHALKTCPFPVTWSTRIATSTFTLMIPSLFISYYFEFVLSCRKDWGRTHVPCATISESEPAWEKYITLSEVFYRNIMAFPYSID